MLTITRMSETYGQLHKIFQSLEAAHFEANRDFGENVAEHFTWFLSPPAVIFLERRQVPEWIRLKNNQRLRWELEKWEGYTSKGATINLVLQ